MYIGNVVTFTDELISSTLNASSSNRLVSARDAHGIVYANKSPYFKALLNKFYCNLPDGMPLVWVCHLKGFRQIKRCTGIDTFEHVMSSTANLPIKHFFCGGKKGVAEQLQKATFEKLGNNNVVGTYCPPFSAMSDKEFADLGAIINASGANVIWIGLSSPKQEIFAANLANHVNVNYLITIGAVFDFFTGNIKRAPIWIQNLGLEWLFRLLKEPRRLFSRYVEVVPMFIWLNIKEFIRYILFTKIESK